MKKLNKYQIFATLISCLFTTIASAEIAIIMHPSMKVDLSEKDIADIFLMKVTTFPDGQLAIPLDVDDDERFNEFYKSYTNKTPSQTKAYWARHIFTGKGSPPKKVFDDEEVLELVSKNPNIIGYISTDSLDEEYEVRIVSKK